jgi:hypothetical protein
MTIWIHVPNERPVKPGQKTQTILESIIEKKSMINLVQAFSVSVKHYLRSEPGVYYQDLYPLICFLPRYAAGGQTEADMLPMWHASEDGTHPYDHSLHSAMPPAMNIQAKSTWGSKESTDSSKESTSWLSSLRRHHKHDFDPERVLPTVHVHRPLKPSRNPPSTGLFDYFPFLRIFKVIAKAFRSNGSNPQVESPNSNRSRLGRKRKPLPCDSNVPVEVSLFLSNYINSLIRGGLVQPAIATSLVNTLASLQDTLTNLERIANTPLPFAYQAHLRMSLWLYLFFLPFQIYATFKWLTIPGTAFAAFLLLGFLEIGQEIENPFNYDLNDLDLDDFCLVIQRELHEITAHPSTTTVSDYIFSSWNQPFAPSDRRTAKELTDNGEQDYLHSELHGSDSQPGMMSIQRTLIKGWKDVDTHTRKD